MEDLVSRLNYISPKQIFMEHVLNSKERNQAFVKFIFFFLVTTVLIVLAVYFDYKLPFKDNAVLREKLRTYEGQQYSQEQFLTVMESAKKLIDSMGKQAQPNALLDQEIAKQLIIMKTPAYQEESLYGTLNKGIFNICYDYNDLCKRLLPARDALDENNKLKTQLNDLQLRYDNAQRDLEAYRRSSNLGLSR